MITEPTRRVRGVSTRSAAFPVGPQRLGLPIDYAEVLGTIKARIQQERLSAVITANSAMILLYWDYWLHDPRTAEALGMGS